MSGAQLPPDGPQGMGDDTDQGGWQYSPVHAGAPQSFAGEEPNGNPIQKQAWLQTAAITAWGLLGIFLTSAIIVVLLKASGLDSTVESDFETFFPSDATLFSWIFQLLPLGFLGSLTLQGEAASLFDFTDNLSVRVPISMIPIGFALAVALGRRIHRVSTVSSPTHRAIVSGVFAAGFSVVINLFAWVFMIRVFFDLSIFDLQIHAVNALSLVTAAAVAFVVLFVALTPNPKQELPLLWRQALRTAISYFIG